MKKIVGMKAGVYILLALVAVGVALYLHDKLSRRRHPAQAPIAPAQPAQAVCADASCALQGVCVGEQVARCATQPVTYYDDEELDAYRGRAADAYTAAELEQWRDVLYTLQPADLLGWQQSVKQRGIAMPAPIRDEFIMLYNEACEPHNKSRH